MYVSGNCPEMDVCMLVNSSDKYKENLTFKLVEECLNYICSFNVQQYDEIRVKKEVISFNFV